MDGDDGEPGTSPAVVREGEWSRRKQKAFLEHLSWSVNVSASARSVGMGEPGVYRLRARSPEFRAAWEVALREGYARLEIVMLERAIMGTVKPQYYAGKLSGEMTEYSDRLGMTLLAAHRATVRGEDVERADPTAVRERIAAKLDEMCRRLGGEA